MSLNVRIALRRLADVIGVAAILMLTATNFDQTEMRAFCLMVLWFAIVEFALYKARQRTPPDKLGRARPFVVGGAVLGLCGVLACSAWAADAVWRPTTTTLIDGRGVQYRLRQKPWQTQREFLLEGARLAIAADETHAQR